MTVWIGLLLIVVLLVFNRFGFTFDELEGVFRAKRVFAVLSSGRMEEPSDIDMFHGAAPDVIAMALQKLIPQLSFDSRHLIFALFGVAGIYYVYRFGRRFVDEWTGVFAALFLTVTPMWFGYMFINHKDIPFATMLLAASYYSLLVLSDQTVSNRLWLKTGFAIGLLAAIKFVGLLLLVLFVGLFLACSALAPGARPDVKPKLRHRLLRLVVTGVLGCLVAFVLFWPQFYFGDIAGPGGSRRGFIDSEQFSRFRHKSDAWYGVRYFVITTPLFLLALGAAGVVCAISYRQPSVVAALVISLVSLLVPAVSGARMDNGCRHLLFMYPFFMLVAAYPMSLLFAVTEHRRLARLGLLGTLAACIFLTGLSIYRLFPYQYSYYNALVGGIRGADGLYELDTWRSAHRAAFDLIAARVAPGEAVKIYSCGSKIDYKTHPGFKFANSREDADYLVAQRRGSRCVPEAFDGLPVVGEVRREGVLLARVYSAR